MKIIWIFEDPVHWPINPMQEVIFNGVYMNEIVWILNKISLKYAPGC